MKLLIKGQNQGGIFSLYYQPLLLRIFVIISLIKFIFQTSTAVINLSSSVQFAIYGCNCQDSQTKLKVTTLNFVILFNLIEEFILKLQQRLSQERFILIETRQPLRQIQELQYIRLLTLIRRVIILVILTLKPALLIISTLIRGKIVRQPV